MANENHIHILYAKIPKNLPDTTYQEKLAVLPAVMKEKHDRYRRWEDRAANLFSKILLLEGLRRFGYDYTILNNLEHTPHGRPHLAGAIDFNISHSGDHILCGVAEGLRLGVDIEQVKDVPFSDFEDLMSSEQWDRIRSSADPTREFFRYWAIKESIIKADGRGLSIPLNDIIINENEAFYERKWFLTRLKLDEDYSAYLATDKQTPTILIEEIDLLRD